MNTYDLLVVGAGLSGLVAAVRAAELGARVVVFEAGEASKYPANSRYTGGVFHLAFEDIHAPAPQLREAIDAATGGYCPGTLADVLADQGAAAVAWLSEHGALFGKGGEFPFMSSMLVPFSLREPGFHNHWPDKGADRLLDNLEQQLSNLGGTLLRGHRARRLLLEGGRFSGLQVQVGEAQKRFDGRAVLIADGGFQGNAELVRRYISPRPQDLCVRGAGTGMGDGLLMAEAIGAQLVGLDKFYGHVQCAEAVNDPSLWPYPILDIVASAGIVINAEGQRFCEEGLGGVAMANAIAALEQPLSSFVIMDQKIWEQVGRAYLLPPNPTLLERGAQLYSAPTLEELAAQLNIPGANLEQTVQACNLAVDQGRCDHLQPARSHSSTLLGSEMHKIDQPPYLAMRLSAGITYTMGGIAIDEHCRVLNTQGQTIPGVYAAGAATGGIEGGPRSGYVGGLAKALVFGLRAAQSVIDENAISVAAAEPLTS
ncbi:FAD-dependent oxidoreductase [Pseudomonas typographi]|uniref:FAD-dependent oxidoreductase n=1 Tax=Pseudomonas typographi TaxID=2715964 RepID=UPI00168650E7|nr:FAD-dependent oxidoreductase [Pseudomonas typographi]MBD1550423.1 FAD-dependent oxidoreductase [Pseudomonas typographi]